MSTLRLLLSVALITLSIAACAWQPAFRADDFVNALGISSGGEGPQADRLRELGIRHYRAILKYDLTPADQPQRFQELYDRWGLQAMMLVDPHKDGSPGDVVALLKQYGPGVVDLVEMPNEVNNKFPPQELNLKYAGLVDEAAGAAYQRDYYAALKADPATRDLGVVCFTAIFTDYRDARPCDAFDYANMHSYQGSDVPESSLLFNMVAFNNILPDGAATKPFIPTECGYNVSDDGGADGRGSERAQARGIPMLFAEYFRHGIRRLYLFNLANVDGYGLLDSQGQERPAYSAVKELVNLLKDADWDPATRRWICPVDYEPRALDVTLEGAPPSVHSLVLQKSDGAWYVLLWNSVRNYDPGARRDLVNATVPVTLWFAGAADDGVGLGTPVQSEAIAYTPDESGAHLAATPLTVTNGGLRVEVPDALMLVRVLPANHPRADTEPPAPVRNPRGLTWDPPLNHTYVWPYLVFRNGMFIGETNQRALGDRDALLRPARGYTYEVRVVDYWGRMSAPVSSVRVSKDGKPDLIITHLFRDPYWAKPGDAVTFEAVVKNVGTGPTPQGVPLAVEFSVDGQFTSWATLDLWPEPLQPGGTAILRANGGPRGTPLWTATEGFHVLKGHTDGGYQRIPGELSEYNNMLEESLYVTGDEAAAQWSRTPGGGVILGRMDPQPGSVDLTAEGGLDWVHWGHGDKTGVTRKQGGGGLISGLTEVGSGYWDRQPGCPTSVHWTDGEPTAAVADTHECLWWNCLDHGFSFSAPADTEWRTLKVWVAGLQSGCKLTAHLSDGSGPDYVSTAWARGGEDSNIIHGQAWAACYSFQYHAASPGQTLTVSWTLCDEQNRFLGQGQLQAAALSAGRR